MAAKDFTKPPARSMALEDFQNKIAAWAEALNNDRDRTGLVHFARVHVSPLLLDPVSKLSSFFVQYSDDDMDVRERLDREITKIGTEEVSRWWYGRRDPYAA